MGRFISEWESAHADGARYLVEVCWATCRAECPAGVVVTSHVFSSKARAESFARAIACRLPSGKTADGCPITWVLVSALATTRGNAVSLGTADCYLALDPGGVVVKRHSPRRGFYGARCEACASSLEA